MAKGWEATDAKRDDGGFAEGKDRLEVPLVVVSAAVDEPFVVPGVPESPAPVCAEVADAVADVVVTVSIFVV